MPNGDSRSEPDPARGLPEIFCKRCQHRFVCEEPELSGAVDCPGCSRVAWLSKDDEAKVRDAASRQLKDGSYNRRFVERQSIHLKALALLPETREMYARLANKLRRGAVEICPFCLYDLSGVLDADDPMPCPECGEQTSRPMNTLLWGQRANKSWISSKIAEYAGLAVGGMYWLVSLLGSLLDETDWFYRALVFAHIFTIVALIGLPFGVCVAANRWLRMRNPTMNPGLVLLTSIGYATANLMLALLLVFLANAVIGSL
ncbi:MAG: hypothetical protein ACIAQF_07855 [Phycisphaerales bacterium JB065]